MTSNSQEHTGDGTGLALAAGAEVADMEFVQFHPTCMVRPASARGTLVSEAVRGAGGVLRNAAGRRFMFDYIPDLLRAETAATEEEADAWYADRRDKRRPPELLPADIVARAIDAEVRAGRGTPNGGVFLDIATRRSAEDIRSLLPSTCRRFEQLAGIDITREAIEVAPACHYSMGGVRVDAETASTSVPGLYAAGEVAAGLHGASRLGGNSLADLLVFGRRAGLHAAQQALATAPARAAPWKSNKSRRRCLRLSGAAAAKIPIRCIANCRTACTSASASSGRAPGWSGRWRRSRSSNAGRAMRLPLVREPTTRGGTWRWIWSRC